MDKAKFHDPITNFTKENKNAKLESPLTGRYLVSSASARNDEKSKLEKNKEASHSFCIFMQEARFERL